MTKLRKKKYDYQNNLEAAAGQPAFWSLQLKIGIFFLKFVCV